MVPANEKYYLQIIDRIKNKEWPSDFIPQPSPWFPGCDERCIEVPWALSRYRGQKKVLEIGLSLADRSLVQAQMKLKSLTGCELYGLDIVDINRVLSRFEGFECGIQEVYSFVQGNACDTDFEDDTFDLIFLISTMEHFGFDQFESDGSAHTVFKRPGEYPDHFPVYEACLEDRKALAEVRRILAPNGSLLLTLPMGGRGICVLQDSKGLWAFYKEYTPEEWNNLVRESGLTVVEERFFRNDGERGWVEERDAEQLTKAAGAVGSVSDPTSSIVCAELEKNIDKVWDSLLSSNSKPGESFLSRHM